MPFSDWFFLRVRWPLDFFWGFDADGCLLAEQQADDISPPGQDY